MQHEKRIDVRVGTFATEPTFGHVRCAPKIGRDFKSLAPSLSTNNVDAGFK